MSEWDVLILAGMFAVACGSAYALDRLKKAERRSARLEVQEDDSD